MKKCVCEDWFRPNRNIYRIQIVSSLGDTLFECILGNQFCKEDLNGN